ncbi:MAG: helicase-exonuclease AddAB subunit AddB [Lachnospiraceae bacterium]|nr:helicase-exonuclease AddAB subunit AddB [Lachnospiraceae bacterium]
MGLRFCFGGSGSGKSRKLHELTVEWAEREPERNFLFLVPDQFTMQTQVDLVNASPRGGIMNIDVLSFGRLAHRIFEETGYGSKPVLDDTGKSLVLRKVASGLKEKMPVIGKNLNKIGYIHEVKSAVSEFMQYGISVEQTGELAEYAKKRGALHRKLKDLEIIYGGFRDYIQDRFITTEGTLELLTEAVRKSEIVKGSVIVFDGFTGFTPIQYRLIQELLRLTEQVIVSITVDIRENPFQIVGEQELFYLSKKTVGDLCRFAREAGIKRTDDIYMEYHPLPRFQDNKELAHLEQNLFRYPAVPYKGSVTSIHLREAVNPAAEVQKTCIQIKKLVLEQGYSYRDIAVVTGDLETYGDYFEREGLIYDIPFFLDRTRSLRLNPLIEYIRSALKMVIRDFTYETVFHYLRCGLMDFAPEEIDRLENYVLACGIKGRKRYSQTFVRSREEGALEELNAMRERIMEQIAPLLERKKTAGELVRTLYDFIVAGRIQEKLAVYEQEFQAAGEPERAREYAQIYRLVMELLEQIIALLDEEPMTLQEFAEILDAGFGEIEVGLIPGSIDRIVVGDMERSRLKQVKVLFFLGVNDGNIPKGSSKGGIISDIDREFLQESEFELAPTPRQQMYTQRLYLYMNLTKPAQCLYLSFSRISSQGKSIRPSYLVERIEKLFPEIKVERAAFTNAFDEMTGKRDGLSVLAGELREYAGGRDGALTKEELYSLYHFYGKDEKYSCYAGKLAQAAFEQYRHKPLAGAVARALYGNMLENSVSRLERYAACAYAHFLQYGLLLKEREEFRFEQVDLGNIFHGVLEIFAGKLSENNFTWFDFPEKEGDELLYEALQECALQYGENVLYSNARYEYMTERMYRILKRTIRTLKAQLKEGDFVPASFEMSFQRVEELESVNIALSEHEKMKLRGRIDRIDTCEDEDHIYVKVIDYKSGNKKFDLAALYYGLQLQLVVYMNVAAEITAAKHPDKEVVPAALLYYHVADPLIRSEEELSPEELNRELLKELRTTGVVNSSQQVISLLDKNFSDKSLIVPVERKKDGTFSARSSVIDRQDYETVSQFVNHKIREFGREILNGKIEINPCEQGGRNSCTYCTYRGICEFEAGTAGYQTRVLASYPEDELLRRMSEEIGGDGNEIYPRTAKSN